MKWNKLNADNTVTKMSIGTFRVVRGPQEYLYCVSSAEVLGKKILTSTFFTNPVLRTISGCPRLIFLAFSSLDFYVLESIIYIWSCVDSCCIAFPTSNIMFLTDHLSMLTLKCWCVVCKLLSLLTNRSYQIEYRRSLINIQKTRYNAKFISKWPILSFKILFCKPILQFLGPKVNDCT